MRSSRCSGGDAADTRIERFRATFGGRIPASEFTGGHQRRYQTAIQKGPATIHLADACPRAPEIA
jgi:hypothetical protein